MGHIIRPKQQVHIWVSDEGRNAQLFSLSYPYCDQPIYLGVKVSRSEHYVRQNARAHTTEALQWLLEGN